MAMEIKQFGLQRSGTNLLRVLLQGNFAAVVHANEGGAKHYEYRVPKSLGRELDCVVCVKDPFSWLTSFHRWYHRRDDMTLGEFLLQPLATASSVTDQSYSAKDPVRYWNELNAHWLAIPVRAHRVLVSRYEDVIEDRERAVCALAAELGLERTSDEWQAPNNRLRALKEDYEAGSIERNEKFDPAYYRERRYLTEFDDESLGFVRSELDCDLMDRLGYELDPRI